MTIREIRVVQVMGWRTGDDGRIRREPVSWTIQVLRDGSDTFEDVTVLYREEETVPDTKGAVKTKTGEIAGSGEV